METILERVTQQQQMAEQEAQKHNAQIRERYKRLQDAEADQFAQSHTEERNATDYTVRASVLAPERPSFVTPDAPVFEQTPQVTEFVRERIESPVFTTDKFQTIEQPVQQSTTFAPAATTPAATVETAATVTSVAAQYSLTNFAKAVMAAFAAAVIVMLTLICVNSALIRQKTVEYQALQTQNVQLHEEYEALQRRIQDSISEETIREYALSQGMIQGWAE